MAKRRKRWSRMIEHAGYRVRLYERAGTSVLWGSVVMNGSKRRVSLKTSDRSQAEVNARALAEAVARETWAPSEMGGRLPFRTLVSLFMKHRGPHLSPDRRRRLTTQLALWETHLTADQPDFPTEDISDTYVESYMAARRSGKLRPPHWTSTDCPAEGTLANELRTLRQVCRWGTRHRIDGKPLLRMNPTADLSEAVKPVEKNPRRPRLSEARYKALRGVAGDVDPTGTLDTLMAVAWGTGRRISAILHLRASDVRRGERQVALALQAIGDDPANAKSWPVALRWDPEWDKLGHGDVAPINDAVANALDARLRRYPVIGDGWLFPDARDASEPMNRARAANLLRKAERAAGLEKIPGLGWHGFRRAWATARKAMPLADVQRVGGWRDAVSLQRCYQGSDAETALAVAQVGT